MTAPNHIIGGVVVTGVFGGISGINVLEDWKYIVICIIASLLPDIDHPGSMIGRPLLPLSKFINRTYGHRTVTHSLAALAVATLFMWLIAKFAELEGPYTFLVFCGYFSHLIFDMMTVQGVPLFYPWALNPCVIPGKPEARFVVSDVKSEIRIFAFFGLCFFLLQPLMTNGFWTQYNRLFGSTKHLASEYNKSTDLLEVDYRYKMGSEEFKGKGYVIEASENKTTLLQDGKFKFLDKATMQGISVIPTHTNKQLRFKTQSFVAITTDSLNKLTVDSMIMDIDIQCNNKFTTSTFETGNKFKGKYLIDFFVEEIEAGRGEPEQFVPATNPRIKTLETKIKNLKKEEVEFQEESYKKAIILDDLKSKLKTETGIYEREKLMQQIKDQEKEMNDTFSSDSKVRDLKNQILELQQSDWIKNQEKRIQIERKNREGEMEPTRYSGIVRYLIIE